MKLTQEMIEHYKHKRIRVYTDTEIFSGYAESVDDQYLILKQERLGRVVWRKLIPVDTVRYLEEVAKSKRQICTNCGMIHEYRHTPFKICRNCGKRSLILMGVMYARRSTSGKDDTPQKDD